MPVAAVAKKEYLDAVRSNTLLGLTLLFALWAGFLAAIQWVPVPYRDSEVATSTLVLLNSMRQSMLFFVPLIGLGMGYGAVVTERESGRIRLTLALPHSRRAVVVGKYLGRTAVVGTAILGGFVPAALIGAATYATFDLGLFVVYSLLTVAYGAVYVAIGVGVSATLDSKRRALGATVGLYALFMVLWDAGLYALQLLTIGPEVPAGGLPEWIPFLGVCNPSTAFVFAVRTVLPVYEELTFYPESSAWFLQHWVGIPVLVVWALVPLAVGTARFRRIDL